MRQCFALRTLVRAWSQYREDRAVMMGENLIGGECAAERDAFLTLLAAALPDPRSDLARAIQRVRQTAICERTKNTASDTPRSEERRVGKECVRTCRSRRSHDPEKKKTTNTYSPTTTD